MLLKRLYLQSRNLSAARAVAPLRVSHPRARLALLIGGSRKKSLGLT